MNTITFESISYFIITIVTLISVYSDFMFFKIFNKVVYPTMIIGMILCTFHWGAAGLLHSFLRIMVFTILLIPLYLLRFLGAGDIKLLSAIASFLSFKESAYIVILSFLSGGFIGIILIILRKNGVSRFKNLFSYLKNCFYSMNILPYTFDKSDHNSIFRFSYAILAGLAIHIISTFLSTSI